LSIVTPCLFAGDTGEMGVMRYNEALAARIDRIHPTPRSFLAVAAFH